MKKIYAEPDFELVNFRLTADILKSSMDSEGDIGDEGSDFDDDFEFDFGD